MSKANTTNSVFAVNEKETAFRNDMFELSVWRDELRSLVRVKGFNLLKLSDEHDFTRDNYVLRLRQIANKWGVDVYALKDFVDRTDIYNWV